MLETVSAWTHLGGPAETARLMQFSAHVGMTAAVASLIAEVTAWVRRRSARTGRP